MSTTYDCIVIGGGVMGAATAWYLAKEGQHVLLLEQFEAGHAHGSSHGDGRIYRTLYSEPEYIALMRRALELWHILEEECGQTLLCECGCLATCKQTDRDRLQPILEVWAANNVAYELLEANACRQRFPQFNVTDAEVAIFQEKECGVIFASVATLMLWQAAQAAGAECRDKTHATQIHLEGKEAVQVTLESGDVLHSKKLVLAGGAWNRLLARHFNLALPLTVTREMVAYFPVAPNAPDHTMNGMPAFVPDYFVSDFEIYVLPQVQRPASAFLQSNDMAGVKIGLMWQGMPLKDEQLQQPPEDLAEHERYVSKLRSCVSSRFPHLLPSEIHTMRCLYTTTPDKDFVVDLLPDAPQVVLLAGFSGHGFKFGPAIGEAAADLVLNRVPHVPLNLFSLHRDAIWQVLQADAATGDIV